MTSHALAAVSTRRGGKTINACPGAAYTSAATNMPLPPPCSRLRPNRTPFTCAPVRRNHPATSGPVHARRRPSVLLRSISCACLCAHDGRGNALHNVADAVAVTAATPLQVVAMNTRRQARDVALAPVMRARRYALPRGSCTMRSVELQTFTSFSQLLVA